MYLTRISRRVLVVGLLILPLAGGDALADRGDRGGGGGRRSSGDGGGGHSRSGGGGGRSWSGGGGGDSSRGMSSGQSSRSFSGGSSRSFSSGGERATRSFSGGATRSFSDTGGGSSISRSWQGRSSTGSSSDGAASAIRSLGGQSTSRSFESMRSSRDSGNNGSSFRGTVRGTPSIGDSNDGNSPRSFRSGSQDTSQFSRFFGSSRSRTDTPTDSGASNLGRRLDSGDSNRRLQELNSQGPSEGSQILGNTPRGDGARGERSAGAQSRRQYTTGRPSNEQVRDFLQLRRDDATRQAGNVDNGRFDGNLRRRDGNADLSRNVPDNIRQLNLRNRSEESRNEGDRAWAGRFGNGNSDRGDRSLRLGENGPRDGNWSRRLTDANRRADVGGDHGRSFGDRGSIDRNYQGWRKNAWHGERGDGHDHRDRSGRWKDGDRFTAAHRIRDHWKGHHDHKDLPFHDGWWKGHHGHHRHWHHWDDFAHRHHRPFYWWNWCSAPRLTTWITFGWQTPYYWDYGPGEYIYCHDNVVYVNDVWFQPAPVFYENTVVLAQRAPDWTPEQAAQVEWLPLGVFAIARDGVADTNVLLQLAVTNDGVIGGTVFNQTTGATFAIEGTVENDTQRAVWTYVDETSARIVMETSIFNLTQPEATGLIHYSPENIQVVQLVRLEDPGVGTATAVQP